MTPAEKILFDYIEEESNALLLELKHKIEFDGFKDLHDRDCYNVETLAIKILAHTHVKFLSLLTEKMGHPNIALAYMEYVPMHVELLKMYVIKEIEAQARGKAR